MPKTGIDSCRGCPVYLWMVLLISGLQGMGSDFDDQHNNIMTRKLEINTSSSKHNLSRSFLSVGFPHFVYKWAQFQFRSPKAIALARALSNTVVRIYGSPLFTKSDIQAYRYEHRPVYDEEYYYDDAVADASLKDEYEEEMTRRRRGAAKGLLQGDHKGKTTQPDYNEEDYGGHGDYEASMTHKDEDLAGNNSDDIGSMAEFAEHDPYALRLTRDLWIDVVRFARAVKWEFMFGFTTFSHINGYWDTRYARTFLEMSQREQIPIPVFHMGNEPNIYNKDWKINATQVARDFSLFVNLMKEYPFYKDSKLIGPDVTQFGTSKKFFEKFLKAKGCNYVDEISFHHYYIKEKERTLQMFMSVDKLNNFTEETMKVGRQLLNKYNCSRPLRLTETSSVIGGGDKNFSNAFVAGFTWMDKLGQSALHQITQVVRHTFFGSSYALVEEDLKPNPDYYLSLMFKRFVEGPVFKVRKKFIPKHIRAYANCAREYPHGSLIVYLMNLGEGREFLNFTQFFTQIVSVYRFTAPGGNLKSKRVLMNGEELKMRRNTVPVMKASREMGNAVVIPPKSYAFIVISGARIKACKDYFQSELDEPEPPWQDASSTFAPASHPNDNHYPDSSPIIPGDLRLFVCIQIAVFILHNLLDLFINSGLVFIRM